DIPAHWMTYLSVTDIQKAEQDTVREGGEIMRPSALVPGVGKLAVVTDSAGALIGLIEPEAAMATANLAIVTLRQLSTGPEWPRFHFALVLESLRNSAKTAHPQ